MTGLHIISKASCEKIGPPTFNSTVIIHLPFYLFQSLQIDNTDHADTDFQLSLICRHGYSIHIIIKWRQNGKNLACVNKTRMKHPSYLHAPTTVNRMAIGTRYFKKCSTRPCNKCTHSSDSITTRYRFGYRCDLRKNNEKYH